MKNVLYYLEKTTKENESKIAVIEKERKCSYKELLEKSKKIGTALIEISKPKRPIPILMEKGIDTLCAFFGAVYAGCFYVLLNPELPDTRLKSILETLETNLIITDNLNYELAKKLTNNILKINELEENIIDENKLKAIRDNALSIDPLYVNFTSGSTGTPKGVVISHQTVIDFIDIFTNKFNITNLDIIANQAPFDFDVSVKDIYSAIKCGATLVIIPKTLFSKPAELLDYICENNITTLIWAVSALCLITTFHGLDYKVPSTVNKIFFSGEVMPIKHIKQWIEKLPNANFVNLYGPTEITCNCTYHVVDKKLNYENRIPIGKPFENEGVFLLNENKQKIENINEIGEICVKGNTLALGYYNNKEQTEEKFIQNPLNNKYMEYIYLTGDLAYYDAEGNLNFSGRKDFQIKHQGHRIELEEIENEIEKIENVQRVCCIYEEERKKIHAFYIGNIDKKEINVFLKKVLPIYMMPNIIERVEKFPMTKNGKIDRKSLIKQKEGK